MNKIVIGMLLATFVFCGRAFALGVDVGPVHVHSKGATQDLKIIIDTIVKGDDSKAVTKLHAHRKGDSDAKFEIKVASADLDKETQELIKTTLTTGVIYKAHIEKLEDNWKLLMLRKSDDD